MLSPIITVLDSLGLSHSKTARNLKDYLIEEGKSKRNMGVEIPAMTAKGIPRQSNFCDCGLFLLGYVQKFLENPQEFVAKILSQEFDEVQDWQEMNPTEMRNIIREFIRELHEEQEVERRKNKKDKKASSATNGVQDEAAQTTEKKQGTMEEDGEITEQKRESPQVVVDKPPPRKESLTHLSQSEEEPIHTAKVNIPSPRKAPRTTRASTTPEATPDEMLFHAARIEIPDSQPQPEPKDEAPQVVSLHDQLHTAAAGLSTEKPVRKRQRRTIPQEHPLAEGEGFEEIGSPRTRQGRASPPRHLPEVIEVLGEPEKEALSVAHHTRSSPRFPPYPFNADIATRSPNRPPTRGKLL